MKLPWIHQARQRPESEPMEDPTFELERNTMDREITHIKRLNEYLLNRAVAQGRISEETATAIRTTQSYEHEVLDFESGRVET